MPDGPKFSARYHDFLVFIDGVEVPWLTLQARSTINQASTLDIFMEPDNLIEKLRPRALVHVFMVDPYREVNDADPVPANEGDRPTAYYMNNAILMFEGEVHSINESLSDQNVAMVVGCIDLTNIITNTSLDLVQVTSAIRLPLVNGSTFYGSFLGLSGDSSILNAVIYAAMGFNPEFVGDTPADAITNLAIAQNIPDLKDKAAGEEYFYHEAVRIALKHFTQFNASYRLLSLRTKLFDKISGIPDQTFKRLMTARAAQTLITTGFQNVPHDTLGQLMNFMLGMGLHQRTSMFFPVKTGGEREAWSQYLFLPNLYYAVPPTCNWLFKEHIRTINSSRVFLEEPTRVLIRDPMVGNLGLVHLAPESLTDFLARTGSGAQVPPLDNGANNPLTLHGSRSASDDTRDVSGEAALDRANFRIDRTAEEGPGNPNLLKFLTPEEIEKGLVHRVSDFSLEYFASQNSINAAFGQSVDEENDLDKRQLLNNNVQQSVNQQSDYIRYMQTLANYRLALDKLNRNVTAEGPFNPWAVAGFPFILCRKNRGYRGLLRSVSHTISAAGASATQYEFAQTTLFRPRSDTDLQADASLVAELDTANERYDSSRETLRESFDVTVTDEQLESPEFITSVLSSQVVAGTAIRDLNFAAFTQDVGVWQTSYGLDAPLESSVRVASDLGNPNSLTSMVSAIRVLNTGMQGSYDNVRSRVVRLPVINERGESRSTPRQFFPVNSSLLLLADHAHNYSYFGSPIPEGVSETDFINLRQNTSLTITYWSGTSVDDQPGTLPSTPFSQLLFVDELLPFESSFSNALAALGEAAPDIFEGTSTPQDLITEGSVVLAIGEGRTITTWSELVAGIFEIFSDRVNSFIDATGSRVQAAADFTEARVERERLAARVRENLSATDEDVEQPPIMPFANPDLLDPARVEQVYAPVLGEDTRLADQSAPLSLLARGVLTGAFSITDPALTREHARRLFLATAQNIFDFSSEDGPTTSAVTNNGDQRGRTLYDQWENEGDVHRRVSDFGKRPEQSRVTLGDFLSMNRLELFTDEASHGPATHSFFVMRSPSLTSYFDRLTTVDSPTGPIPTAGIIRGDSAEADIAFMRAVYSRGEAPFLYERGRQEILLAYSREHFVSRGLKGR